MTTKKRSLKDRLLLAVVVLAAASSLSPSFAFAQESAEEAVEPASVAGVALFAGLLALWHVLAPQLRRAFEKRATLVGSFGGGMAIGYVFVHLLPELKEGHPWLGERIFVLALAGFVIFYGLHELTHGRSKGEAQRVAPRLGFYLNLIPIWLFNWLVVYGVPVQHMHRGLAAVPMAVALWLHFIHKDYLLWREYPGPFDKWGRYVLALAPVVGWVTAFGARSNQEAINDIFVALLAGSVLYSVFREELPEHVESRFPSFLLGVVVFLAAVLIAGLV